MAATGLAAIAALLEVELGEDHQPVLVEVVVDALDQLGYSHGAFVAFTSGLSNLIPGCLVIARRAIQTTPYSAGKISGPYRFSQEFTPLADKH
jgi:hypothetical protein